MEVPFTALIADYRFYVLNDVQLALKPVLRPEYRELFLLRQMEGLPVKEGADIPELPEGTVKTCLHRARKQLIDFLTEKGWE